jgi:MFS family permease
VYALQILLGVLGAMHKTCEKALVGDVTEGSHRGKQIGAYHGWIAVFSALAIIAGGYLIDLFALSIIFYIGSCILFVSGFAVLKIEESKR